jgi:hypothetical protein
MGDWLITTATTITKMASPWLRKTRNSFCVHKIGMRASLAASAVVLLLTGCSASSRQNTLVPPQDNTADVQKAVDAGGVVMFPAGKYVITKTIVVSKSNTVILGAGPETVFEFRPTLPQVHCENDRAFTTPCDVLLTPRRQITAPIAIGESTFSTAGDVSDLWPGDTLLIQEKDQKAGDVVVVDWAEVASSSGNTVRVQQPFRTAFPNARPWDPDHDGLGFYKFPRVTENVEFRNFSIIVPDSGEGAPGISVFAARHTLIDNINVQDPHGQALYSYLAKDLTIQNSQGYGDIDLNEFGATVDLDLHNNIFSCSHTAGFGLDYGTGFFNISGNQVPSSADIGVYFLYGIHDGTFTNNTIAFVSLASVPNANAVDARGTANLRITANFLAGGAGAQSTGITIGPAYLPEVPIASSGNTISPNSFGPDWAVDYDPTNVP